MLQYIKSRISLGLIATLLLSSIILACTPSGTEILPTPPPAPSANPTATEPSQINIMKKPLITNMYTADPSAHVFENKLYIYPSHDLDHNNPETQNGDQFDMEDYHVFSMENMHSLPVDHGEVLNVKNVPWAEKQMWAPDAAFKNDTYYLYFPAKDHEGLFRIGVATSKSPAGPFKPEADFILGSFSIDPCVFVDDDGQAYMYFGGLWGGQLEKWKTEKYDSEGVEPGDEEPALGPRVVKLASDMLHFDGPVGEASITSEDGNPVLAGNHSQRFFEASWMHKYNGTYYLSYSTGDTHYIAYATSKSPTGPFVFQGYILLPVLGWTTHHSIVEFQGKWYLFYHDSSLSEGIGYKRSIKVAELTYNPDGTIVRIAP
jgi:beta-xylosidase